MKRMMRQALLAPLDAVYSGTHASAERPTVGKPAPDFKLADLDGKPHQPRRFQGKIVVLEWNNPGCPFVQKHYEQRQHAEAAKATRGKDGVVWLAVNSGAPGKQGHYDAGRDQGIYRKKAGASPTAYLLDADGTVGKAYGAKTTPHMFVIDKAGTLVYAGGIDDKPTPNNADVTGARNHVLAALAELKAGKPCPCRGAAPTAATSSTRTVERAWLEEREPCFRSLPARLHRPRAASHPTQSERHHEQVDVRSISCRWRRARAVADPCRRSGGGKAVSLGVQFSGNPEGTEAEVVKMLPDRTGAAIGFRVGDILIEAGGKPVSREVLMAYMKEKKEGDQLSFKVRRGSAVVELAGKGMAAPEGAPPLTPQPEE